MKVFDSENIKIKDTNEYKEAVYVLDVPSLYGITYLEDLNNKIFDFVAALDNDKPMIIKIIGDFDLLEEADQEDKEYFIDTIASLFVDAAIREEKEDRRKGILPKCLKDNFLSRLTKFKLINNKIFFKKFNIFFLNKQEKIIKKVF